MTRGSQLFIGTLFFALGVALPGMVLGLGSSKLKQAVPPREADELHIAGSGINVYYAIPSEGISLSAFLEEFELPKLTTTIQLDRANTSRPTIFSITPNSCAIRPESVCNIDIMPADTLWLLGASRVPFPHQQPEVE